jgi:hypothetical protein
MTLMTSLDPTELPIFFDFRMGRNTQFDFLVVILGACKRNKLKRGDYLILDNAAIHSGNDILPLLRHLLDSYGISFIIYLFI